MHTLDSTASNLIMNKVLERCAWCHTGLKGSAGVNAEKEDCRVRIQVSNGEQVLW